MYIDLLSVILSDICSGVLSGILSDVLFAILDILSGMCSGPCVPTARNMSRLPCSLQWAYLQDEPSDEWRMRQLSEGVHEWLSEWINLETLTWRCGKTSLKPADAQVSPSALCPACASLEMVPKYFKPRSWSSSTSSHAPCNAKVPRPWSLVTQFVPKFTTLGAL